MAASGRGSKTTRRHRAHANRARAKKRQSRGSPHPGSSSSSAARRRQSHNRTVGEYMWRGGISIQSSNHCAHHHVDVVLREARQPQLAVAVHPAFARDDVAHHELKDRAKKKRRKRIDSSSELHQQREKTRAEARKPRAPSPGDEEWVKTSQKRGAKPRIEQGGRALALSLSP